MKTPYCNLGVRAPTSVGKVESFLASIPDRLRAELGVAHSLSECKTPSEFRDCYLCEEVVSKYPFKIQGIDRKKVAISKFLEMENHCSLVNETIGADTRSPGGLSWFAVLETARRTISRLLGDHIPWSEVEDRSGFGPGASTSKRRTRGDAFFKIGSKPDVTQDAALLAWCAVYRVPRWFEILSGHIPSGNWAADYFRFPPEIIFNLVPGNKVTTVPKNSKTDRVIAIEPDLNMFLQKGFGGVIRRKLRSVGIDLNDQTPNQRLARQGSLNGTLATIDFSSASDTVSTRIVEELLPPDWLTALKQLRSSSGVLPDGTRIQYSKFSSMGNGFTFELESLIFWALARACLSLHGMPLGADVLSVYGDDLIVPVECESEIAWVFTRAGFILNKEKSFFSGPFRESCGKHYFLGEDVTPFYIRQEPKTVHDLYSICNKIRAWAELSYGLDGRLLPLYEEVKSLIPERHRLLVPKELGDVGLHANLCEAAPIWDRKLHRMKAWGMIPIRRDLRVDGSAAFVKWFLSKQDREDALDMSVGLIPRVSTHVGRKHQFGVATWSDQGPWL